MNKLMLGLVALLFLAAPNAVVAQSPAQSVMLCFPEGKVRADMARLHKEMPILQAVTLDGRLVTLLSNEDGSSWTLVLVHPGKPDCVMATGQGVFQIPYKAPSQGS